MQLFNPDPTIVLMFVLTTKSWKNNPQKLLRIPQINFFELTAQTAQTEEFMFQNLAFWPTLYRTGQDLWPKIKILKKTQYFVYSTTDSLSRSAKILFLEWRINKRKIVFPAHFFESIFYSFNFWNTSFSKRIFDALSAVEFTKYSSFFE